MRMTRRISRFRKLKSPQKLAGKENLNLVINTRKNKNKIRVTSNKHINKMFNNQFIKSKKQSRSIPRVKIPDSKRMKSAKARRINR